MNKYLCCLSVLILLLGGCATLPENVQRIYSTAATDTVDTSLGRDVAELKADHPDKSGFFLLGNGLDAFVARAVFSGLAERTIDIQYYLYHGDLVGGLIAYGLLEAADRGVRVRMLLDDMGLEGRDINIATLDSHPNIEIRIFNPFSRNIFRVSQFLTRFGVVTRRMHNKSFTVDNQVTIVGGRNIGNEYFDADPELAFGDLDVLAVGPVVREVSESFDAYWNSELSYPIATLVGRKVSTEKLENSRPQWEQFIKEEKESDYYKALLDSNLARQLEETGAIDFRWGQARALYDDPEKIVRRPGKKELQLAPQLAPFIDEITDELIIYSAYFVPGRDGVLFLKELRERGVRVRILTNSLSSTDVSLVHAGYGRYRRDLLRAGIELYEVDKKVSRKERKKDKKQKGLTGSSKASLHAKAFVFDREELFIGSLNLDPRSVELNTEIGIVFHSPELGALMGEDFDRKVTTKAFQLHLHKDKDGLEYITWTINRNGREEVYTVDPYTSFWRRLMVNLAGLLPIESQL